MKATLEFDLTEEDYAFQSAVNGDKYRRALYDTIHYINQRLKHDELYGDQVKTLKEVRAFMLETQEDLGVPITF